MRKLIIAIVAVSTAAGCAESTSVESRPESPPAASRAAPQPTDDRSPAEDAPAVAAVPAETTPPAEPLAEETLAAGAPAAGGAESSQPTGPEIENGVSVAFMVRGYCRARTDIVDEEAPGGFAVSDNVAHDIDFQTDPAQDDYYLLAQPDVVTPFGKREGMRVLLVNPTAEVRVFSACDSRLSIVQEARDATGTWKPIEYLPDSWCGNSYHRVMLGPHRYWAFPAPRYVGTLRTRLRFRYGEILSNEFDGSVNASQFTTKQGYSPRGIMDPYHPVEGK